MNECVFVEWVSADAHRLAYFYERVCGWGIASTHDATISGLGSGTYTRIAVPVPARFGAAVVDAALVQQTAGTTVVTIATDDFDALCARVVEAGGRIVSDVLTLEHDVRFVYAADTDGRVIGCIERAKKELK
jgi:predicted enzyme related to lactoylglutathione lyase